jgi:branched-chain amino acid transport system substrate-binding protein
MGKARRTALGALVASAALVAGACGGGSSDGASGGNGAPAATVDPGIKAGVAAALGGGSTTSAATGASSGGGASTSGAPAAEPTSMDGWEALWTKQREAIVKRITDNKWGKSPDGKTVTGPEGFTIDLSKCPAGWSDTEGLSDTEIKIGHTTALSGTLADYGNIAKGMVPIFDYYGKQGAYKDSTGKTRTVNLMIKDDGYDSARTIPLVDELIDSEKVFAMWTLGSPNTLKTYDKLNERCIPQPFAMTGHPAWGDPVNHPWTTGEQMAYNTEAVLWGGFLEQHQAEFTDGKVTVASLVLNNDAGKAWDSGFKAWLAQSAIRDKVDYVSETVEAQAPTVTDPMTTIAAKNPDVFIAMVAGTLCTQTITEAAQNGMKEKAKYLFQPSVCKANSFVGKDKVGGDGSASNGWWVVGGGVKDLCASTYDDDPFVQWGKGIESAAGYDCKMSSGYMTGARFAWDMPQVLRIAGALPGGLDRTNFIVALRSLDMTAPFMLSGIKFNMDGNKDAYLTEGSEFAKYDAASQSWKQEGAVIDVSGRSKNCTWDQSTASCK